MAAVERSQQAGARPRPAPFLPSGTGRASALGALDSAMRSEFWASLALRHTRGLGPRTRKRLLAFFGSAYAAVRQPGRWGEAGVGGDKAAALATEAWRTEAKEEWDACRGLDGVILLWTDPRYPAQLKELPDAPGYLYCRGDMELLGGACLGIVGKRACTPNGIRAAAHMARGLAAAGVTVVSGLAVGIDRAAHMASVDLPGGSIAVLGAGLNVDYPKDNRDLRRKLERRGLLLSEYAPDTPPDAGHFPIRNRIITGLSLGVLVVEAALQSGSLISARLALEQDRSVYVWSGAMGTNAPQPAQEPAGRLSEGCSSLLEQGALGVTGYEDILRDLKPQLRSLVHDGGALPMSEPDVAESGALPPQRSGTSPEALIEGVLAGGKLLSADDLCRELSLTAAQVGAALIVLEVRGRVKRLADLRYAATEVVRHE